MAGAEKPQSSSTSCPRRDSSRGVRVKTERTAVQEEEEEEEEALSPAGQPSPALPLPRDPGLRTSRQLISHLHLISSKALKFFSVC